MKKSAAPSARVIGISILVIVAVLLADRSYAGSNGTTAQGVVLSWPSLPQVTFRINPGGVPGFTGELDRLVVAGALREAFRVWTELPNAAISFIDGGLTTDTNQAFDGVSLVTFQDPSFALPPGTLAITLRTFDAVTGMMLDADILYNTQLPNPDFFSPVGADNSVDLVAVAVHEIGHLLGLDHSGLFSSIMNPFLRRSNDGTASRTIRSDDAITMAAIYPAPNFTPSTGSIFGTVTTSMGGPVRSAHVVAVSQPAGVPVASQLTGPAGGYIIKGLPPGSYRVLVEPLDGPISLQNFRDFYSNGQNDFTTTMLGGLSSPTTLSVSVGQQISANVALPPNPTSKLNISSIGILSDSSCTGTVRSTSGPLYLTRGGTYCVVVYEDSNSTDTSMTFSAPDIASLGNTGGVVFSSGNVARVRRITIGGSAATGTSNLTLANTGGSSTLPGGIVVTSNPTIVGPPRNLAGFSTTLAPGSAVLISGTDLAEQTAFATSFPLPTNLGGISLKFGNRFAPLFAASPTRIVAMVPYEVSGQVNVQVVTGPGAGGNAVGVGLSPTAPEIFSSNADGTGQGAIYNADNSLASSSGGRPAKPGDVVTIYAAGLGPVSPASPSGLQAGASGTSVPSMVNNPTVRIGGQVATVNSARLVSGFAGFYVITAVVPANASLGESVPAQITTFEGQTSNTVTMAVSP